MTETSPVVESAPARRWASVKDAATYVDASPRTIHQLIKDGYLTGYRLGPKIVRIDLDELDQVALRPMSQETAIVTTEANVIAEELSTATRCLMKGDHIGMAQVLNGSRYPLKMHLAAALNVISRMAREADDPEQFLELVAEIIRRD